jgi:Icc-related predicted phosphoesterase
MELSNARDIPGIHQADLVIITGDMTNYGGRDEAKKVLDATMDINPNVLALPGNLDQPEVVSYLDELGLSLHGRGKIKNGLGFIGLGGSNYTPFNTPTEFSEAELANLLAAGYEQIAGTKNIILVSHPPPYLTTIDRIASGEHVGSTAVREFIEQKQPPLCLTGHIHESKGIDRIGNTLLLNPGMIKNGSYIDVTFINDELKASLQLTDSAETMKYKSV